ncbi:MAG: hypothetical protein ABW168_01460 [Sedimenticola sp.]
MRIFVRGYNEEHLHSGIRYVTPAERYSGEEREIQVNRKAVYTAAKERSLERWSGKTWNWESVEEVWLNPDNSGGSES